MAEVKPEKKWKYIVNPVLPPIDLRVGANVRQLREHAPRKRTKGTGSS